MEASLPFTMDFLNRLYAGEYPVTLRVRFGLFGSYKAEFMISDEPEEKTPFWLKCLSEERMQQAVILDFVNVPKHLKGEWKAVFDEKREVVVTYIPTEEEAEEAARLKKRHDETWEIALMCASL